MISIKEVLPNPVGADGDGEYIILVNDSEESVSLSGWTIKDKSGKEFSLSGYVIEAQGGLEFSRDVTNLTLNNSNEFIELLGPDGEVEDSLSYVGSVDEGRVILQDAEITEEVYDELFDELAGPGDAMAKDNVVGLTVQFWIILIIVGFLAAAMSIFLLNYSKGKK